jgi:hypothetical protein
LSGTREITAKETGGLKIEESTPPFSLSTISNIFNPFFDLQDRQALWLDPLLQELTLLPSQKKQRQQVLPL